MRKNKFIKRKQDSMKTTITLLILILGLGYALLQSNLTITGLANMANPTWNIHWENVQVSSGSVTGTNVVTAPTIQNQTTVNYSIILPKPGDYYEFTVDAVNSGTIDGMIDSITSKLNGATITTLPEYLSYTVTYSDGAPLAVNQELKAGTTETYKVKVKYRDDITLSQIPVSDQTLSLQFTVKYRQATSDATSIDHSFANQSWEAIVSNVKSGNTSNYNVGDTKTVDMGTLGTHTLRIANMSTPSECSTTGFSQTACGFVLEFADIITTHNMNPVGEYKGTQYNYGWNVDGWPASSMRDYISTDIYNAIPEVLRNAIINTTVVSGHGSTSGESNFTSTDRLYLLDAKEIYGESFTSSYNTAKDYERQLDYYKNAGVTASNYSGAIKQRNGSNSIWWLRSASSVNTNGFYGVYTNGNWIDNFARTTSGVSPAFRIG